MRAPTIRHHATVVAGVVLSLLLVGPASAQRNCQAPPGRSALEQYCESIPGAGGQQSGGGGGGRVDRKTARELRAAGDAGAAILGLARSSGGTGGSSGNDGDGNGGGSASGSAGGGGDSASGGSGSSDAGAAGDAEDEPSGSVLSALTSSAEDGPTVGGALAWVLIAIAIGCFALAWLGWRRRRGDEPESSA